MAKNERQKRWLGEVVKSFEGDKFTSLDVLEAWPSVIGPRYVPSRNEVQMLLKRFRSKLGISVVGELPTSSDNGSRYVLLLYAED